MKKKLNIIIVLCDTISMQIAMPITNLYNAKQSQMIDCNRISRRIWTQGWNYNWKTVKKEQNMIIFLCGAISVQIIMPKLNFKLQNGRNKNIYKDKFRAKFWHKFEIWIKKQLKKEQNMIIFLCGAISVQIIMPNTKLCDAKRLKMINVQNLIWSRILTQI